MTRRVASIALVLAGTLAAPLFAEYPSPELAGAFESLESGQYVKVRETAEQALRRNQNSFEGWYLLGAVYARGEANLPRARYCLTRARTLIEQRWPPPISFDGPWRIHLLVLNELIDVASLSDSYQEELDLIEVHDKLYKPPKIRRAGWALMKLGKTAEAEQRMISLLGSGKESEEIAALNTLGSIEAELGNVQQSYEWFTRLVGTIRVNKWDMSAVYLANRAETELSLLKFPDAESDLLEASKHFDSYNTANPFEDLALYYASSGRLPEAVSAVRQMQAWNASTDSMLADQKWSESQQTVATVLMAAGYDDSSLDILRRLLDRPDRHGTSSSSASLDEIGLIHLYREALKLRREHLREEMSWNSPTDWIRALGERASIERELWSARSRGAALIMREGRLNWTTIPYGTDTMSPEWLRPSLREMVGEGLWETEVRKQLRQSDSLSVRQRPYFFAELGESEWNRGEMPQALADLTQAEAGLPGEEVLLRARVNALLGNAYESTGNMTAAMDRYARALEKDPHAFRALGVALPATVVSGTDSVSQSAASMLSGSPRFHAAKGFRIRISRNGPTLTGRLEGPDGTVYCDVTTPVIGDPKESARAFAKAFHAKAFGAKFDLTQSDIGSLEGSNQAGAVDRHNLRDLMGSH